jgi:hypothetical protein
MGDAKITARRYRFGMETISNAAQRLILEHGPHAAGEAFILALDARVDGSKELAAYWVEVAVDIIHTERVGAAVSANGDHEQSD